MEPTPRTCMGYKLVPQSHFTCLFHDHAKCSCIGGPRRLVQSHFTCHYHERSLSLFFVLDKHLASESLLRSMFLVLQFLLFFSFCFHFRAVLVEMLCLAQKHFILLTQVARVSHLRVRTTFGFHSTNIRYTPTVMSAY